MPRVTYSAVTGSTASSRFTRTTTGAVAARVVDDVNVPKRITSATTTARPLALIGTCSFNPHSSSCFMAVSAFQALADESAAPVALLHDSPDRWSGRPRLVCAPLRHGSARDKCAPA